MMGLESCLPLISISDANVIVSKTDVEFSEPFRFFEFVEDRRDEGNWICVFDSMFVQVPIILTGS